MPVLRYTTFAFIFFLLFSCKKDVGKVNFGDYPNEIGKIMVTRCATSGCHNSKSFTAAAGLNLETWKNLFDGSNSGSTVIPYSSRFSYLCYFINSYPDMGLVNEPTMPVNGTPLTRAEVQLFYDWINSGAPSGSGKVMWADNPTRKKVYVVNQGCDVVTVFDSETQLPMRYIEVGTKAGAPDTPHSVRVSPDGKYWYVIFINNNIMQKFRCSDDALVGNIPLSPKAAGTNPNFDAFDWNTMVFTKDGKKAYCVSWTQFGKVAAVDLENMKLLHYLPNLSYPHGVALNDAEDSVYVAAQTGNYLSIIDTAFTVKHEVSVETGMPVNYSSSLDIHEMLISDDKQNILLSCQKTNDVRIFNMSTRAVTAIIPTGFFPQEIVYSPSVNSYYVSCPYDTATFSGAHGVITKINASGFSVTNIRVGFQPHGIGVDEHKKLLYVASRNITSTGPAPHHTSQCAGRNGFVNFIDLNTNAILPKRYEVSVDPYFVYAIP